VHSDAIWNDDDGPTTRYATPSSHIFLLIFPNSFASPSYEAFMEAYDPGMMGFSLLPNWLYSL